MRISDWSSDVCSSDLRDGPNELPRQKKRSPWRIALEVLREPMLALLLAAGLTYLLLGDTGEALILLLFACFSILLTVVQEARNANVLEALRDLSARSEEHTSELQSLMRISYAVFCLNKK